MTISESKEFSVHSSSLKEIRSFAREVLAKDDIFKSTSDDVVLALSEATQNIVKHAYNGEASSDDMRVLITYNNKDLTMELFDRGEAAIPENIKPRDLNDIKAGCLGTFFIGQIMDEVIFKTSKVDWVNHLILTKKF